MIYSKVLFTKVLIVKSTLLKNRHSQIHPYLKILTSFEYMHQFNISITHCMLSLFIKIQVMLLMHKQYNDREIEKLKLSEMTCRQGVIEVAKM